MQDINLTEEKNELLGELDCLNSFIGFAKSFVHRKIIKRLLMSIQEDLFVISANVACPTNVLYLPKPISRNRVLDLQKITSRIEEQLPHLNDFILPQGSQAASALHCVRTLARKVERMINGYLKNPTTLSLYFDRVACLAFALARLVNQQQGIREIFPTHSTVSIPFSKGESHGNPKRPFRRIGKKVQEF